MNMIWTRCLKSARGTVSLSHGSIARQQSMRQDQRVALHPLEPAGYDAAGVAVSRPRVGSRVNSLCPRGAWEPGLMRPWAGSPSAPGREPYPAAAIRHPGVLSPGTGWIAGGDGFRIAR